MRQEDVMLEGTKGTVDGTRSDPDFVIFNDIVSEQMCYRQYKLPLQSPCFSDLRAIRTFSHLVRNVACSLDLHLMPTRVPWRLREVRYLDTPTFALRNASYILRRRAFYTSSIRDCKHEFTLKFRNSDRGSAAAIDLRPNLQSSHRLKFKDNVLAGPQGIRLLYSNACDFKSKDASIVRDLSTLSQIFPGLDRIGVVADVPLVTVNGIAVEEELISLGRIDFGGGIKAKATLAIWRNQLTKRNIVGEFSYQIKCGKLYDWKSRDLAERFFTALHRAAADCSLGWTTKTAILYGLDKCQSRASSRR
jgi:hypothetical protein